jgi:beta-glucanase (GH16 family)
MSATIRETFSEVESLKSQIIAAVRSFVEITAMPRILCSLRPALVIAAALTVAACTRTTTSGGPEPQEWTLSWSDEFDGPAGARVDGAKWVADTGGDGWGNQEREYYTAGAENASLDGGGRLVITARAEPPDSPYRCWYGTCRYTSARLKTKGKFEQTFGRFEARMRIPRGQGIWPAFWMLGADIDQVGWPRCGEIDVMENVGREPAIVHGTIHGPGYSGGSGIGGAYTLATGSFADDYHVFAVEWTPGQIRWLVDGNEYRRITPAGLPPGTTWVFDRTFFMLMNIAVGGTWPGDPDASTVLPQQMLVDYVRVYRR